MFKKYMSIIALSALVSSVVAEECCCANVEGEVKKETVNAECAMGACAQMQGEDCCKDEPVKARVLKGSKVMFKVNRQDVESSVIEANVPHDMNVQLSIDGDAAVNMVLSTIDETHVAIKACVISMDVATKAMMAQEEVVKEVALGEQANIVLKAGENTMSLDVVVEELCDINVMIEQAAQ